MREGIEIPVTDAIKGIIKDKGVTQAELSEKLKVTKQNLSNKMNRDKKIIPDETKFNFRFDKNERE